MFAACLCALSVPAQRPGDFKVLGPGGGGTMFHPAISPHDPQTVLVSCDMSGAYITHDGGQSWRMFNLRGSPQGFVFDPVDPKVIYALGIGLWRSDDTGDTWHLLMPQPGKVKGFTDSTDEADVTLQTLGAKGLVDFSSATAMAIDPLNSKSLSVVFGGALWHSKDGGGHWSEDDDVPGGASRLALVHKNGDHGAPQVVMAGGRGFWLSRGFQPQQLESPEKAGQLNGVELDAIDEKVLMLAVVDGTLYRSWVAATEKKPEVTWRVLKLPGEGGKVRVVASGHDGKTLYASYRSLKLGGQEWEGIAKSTDLGENWTLMWKDAGEGDPNFVDGWIAASLGSNWGQEPLDLVVSTKDHALLYATDLGRTVKSIDGGAHWMGVYSHTGQGGGAISNGLDVLTSYGVHFDPFDPERMFVSYTDIDLMRSDDRGTSWRSSSDGIPNIWRNTTYWLAFDPDVRGRMWGAMSQTHDLPRPRMWRRRSPSTFHGGVCISVDGGKRWTEQTNGIPDAAVTYIVLDPKSPVEARTLYVSTVGHGVYKSVDGGKSWSEKNKGITQQGALAWRLTLTSDGTLYAVIARRSDNGAIGDARDGALYRSRDGAESWEQVALPAGVNGPSGLAVDPREPSRMYLAAWARAAGPHGTGGGIYGTTDAGAHWSLLFGGDQHVYDVTWNPDNPSELYAAGFESSAWHSMDRGEHWQRIAGYNFKAGHRVTPDPAHPGMVYISTFGGGLWYGKVDGAASVEDIATKEIAP